METFMLNYKDEVKKLISEAYEPADMISKEIETTTENLTASLKRILPDNAVDEHLIYECMIEMNYKPQESKPLVYSWYLKRKRNI